MPRKKWTAQTEVSDSLAQLREKRKWQIALRRYVLERNKSSFYAPYFGLDIERLRKWIELQFDSGNNWDNFSRSWQFDYIVPIGYFDFSCQEDLSLCWNFTNISVEKTASKTGNKTIDLLAAKAYFQKLYEATGYSPCNKMVEKIRRIEDAQTANTEKLEDFIKENKAHLDTLSGLSSYEFDQLNTGIDLHTILYEKEFLRKFGS